MKFGQKRRIFFLGTIYNFIIEDPLHLGRKLYEMQRVSPMNMEPSKLPWLK